MNIMLKDTKYTRTVRALRNFVMTVLPLFFLALTGCRNEEDIPERLSGEDDVTVRLNLSTRGVRGCVKSKHQVFFDILY